MLAAISCLFIWIKVLDWLRLFDEFAFFMDLIGKTIRGIKIFIWIMLICYMLFGTSYYILDMSRGTKQFEDPNESDQIIDPIFGNIWFLNAFENQYELGLGEFRTGEMANGDSSVILCYILFILATFFIQIVFLNMLIAIMGESFSEALEEKENNARMTRLNIMASYCGLIIIEEDEEVDEPEQEDEASEGAAKKTTQLLHESVQDKIKPTWYDHLYSITVEDDSQQGNWEGTLTQMKKFV